MDKATLLNLRSLGVIEPFCQQCLNENVITYRIFLGQILNCQECDPTLLASQKFNLEDFRESPENIYDITSWRKQHGKNRERQRLW